MTDRSRESDRDPLELDDVADREELRQRYYGLLQELRVVLPGVQVLMAFLLTTPFASGFGDLDDTGRAAYFVALMSALGSIICLLTPTVFHRVASRTARGARLEWGVRMTLSGVALLAVALTSAAWCIVRLVYGTALANVVAVAAVMMFVGIWVVLPLAVGRPSDKRRDADGSLD
jgi:Na+/melibiose symporter-like transporter